MATSMAACDLSKFSLATREIKLKCEQRQGMKYSSNSERKKDFKFVT